MIFDFLSFLSFQMDKLIEKESENGDTKKDTEKSNGKSWWNQRGPRSTLSLTKPNLNFSYIIVYDVWGLFTYTHHNSMLLAATSSYLVQGCRKAFRHASLSGGGNAHLFVSLLLLFYMYLFLFLGKLLHRFNVDLPHTLGVGPCFSCSMPAALSPIVL